MITDEWLENLEKDTTDPRKKFIVKVLIDSYKHWRTESKKTHSWPYDEHVTEMLWQAEVALYTFQGL
jgi:hypothetical protein